MLYRYRMSTSDGGGYCDCGDSEAFLKDAICDNHLKLSLNKPPKEDILKKYPEGLADRTKMILMQVCPLYNRCYIYKIFNFLFISKKVEVQKLEKFEKNDYYLFKHLLRSFTFLGAK